MFWFNLAVGLLIGFLGLRSLTHYFLPRIEEWKLDLSVGILVFIMTLGFVIEHNLTEKDREAQNQVVESAKNQADSTEQNLNDAKATISRLEESLRQSRAETEMLRKKALPRSINVEARKKMLAVLSPLKGSRVAISCNMGDPEACTFAREIKAVFLEAGWEAKGVVLVQYAKPFLKIRVSFGGEEPSTVVLQVIKLLNDLGFSVHDPPFRNPGATPDQIVLNVGGKD